MFERYTERARRVLFFARYEASQLGSISIETEHLLLGLIREGKGLTSRIFNCSHLTQENIRREIEGRTVFREKLPPSVEIPFSQATKRALNAAAEEADRLLHNYIGTEHLLLALLRDEKSVAGSILTQRGLRLNTVRDDIVVLLSSGEMVDDGDRPTVQSHPPFHPSVQPSHEMWVWYGFMLRRLIARALGVAERQVELPADLDTPAYRALSIPMRDAETREAMFSQMKEALEQQLGVKITLETRPGEDLPVVVVRRNTTS